MKSTHTTKPSDEAGKIPDKWPTYDDVTPPAQLPHDNRVPDKEDIIKALTDPAKFMQTFSSFQTLLLSLNTHQQDEELCKKIVSLLTQNKVIYHTLICSGKNIAAIALIDNNHYGEDFLQVVLDDPEHEFSLIEPLELDMLREIFPHHACIFSQRNVEDAKQVALAIRNVRKNSGTNPDISDDDAYRLALSQMNK